MTEAEIYVELTRLFRQVFRNETIESNAASTAETINGWDSFKFVEIIVTIERYSMISRSTRCSDSTRSRVSATWFAWSCGEPLKRQTKACRSAAGPQCCALRQPSTGTAW